MTERKDLLRARYKYLVLKKRVFLHILLISSFSLFGLIIPPGSGMYIPTYEVGLPTRNTYFLNRKANLHQGNKFLKGDRSEVVVIVLRMVKASLLDCCILYTSQAALDQDS